MGDYFRDNAGKVALLKSQGDDIGLRRAQLGAIHAIASHYTLRKEAALVSMPTGTGKTGVLMLAPFLLESSRALVITPSRMVRDQIAEDFANLKLLKRIGVLPDDLPEPKVKPIESKILKDEQWGELTDSDIVVTTPMGSSPALDDVPNPPHDLFDLLLVDEAHHSPARTWDALIRAFPQAKQILFTATPFRRDRKLLPGRIVYEFPLREAIADGVFGKIEFIACQAALPTPNDVVIAQRAEQEYRADRAANLDHRLMVRTDSRTRAEELKELYEEHTNLQLGLVHGQHTLTHVRRIVEKVRTGGLDGVICVDMFGEGVDMPQLKIAAIHSPHRSLAVTLQFIGRFARTGGAHLGQAKFIALPEEIESETQALYREGAVWEEMVTNLADTRVSAERELREQLHSFEAQNDDADAAVTLAVIMPWYHTKVFVLDANTTVDLHKELEFEGRATIVQRFVSDELNAAVYVTQEPKKPRWSDSPAIQDVQHALFVVYHDHDRRLLFINASHKTEELYASLADQLVTGHYDDLSVARINRALRGLPDPRFYSVGMKHRVFGNQVESYRMTSGGRADGNISNTDAQMYDRGHCFGSGSDGNDGRKTLGISTLSKLWSIKRGFVPEFVAWCNDLATELDNATPFSTGSRLDILCSGEEVATIPDQVIAANWHELTYKATPRAYVDGQFDDLFDLFELELTVKRSTSTVVQVDLEGLPIDVTIEYRIGSRPAYAVTSLGGSIRVQTKNFDGPLDTYLSIYGLDLYLADFSRLHNGQLFRSNLTPVELEPVSIVKVDWAGMGVDITREFATAGWNGKSIHDGVCERLCDTTANVVVYDHRKGEVADFVALTNDNGKVVCEVYHCKGSSGNDAGCRVEDAYEVIGQVVKSVVWARAPERLKEHLTKRIAGGSTIKKGTHREMQNLLDRGKTGRYEFLIRLVQPGISAGRLNDSMKRIVGAGFDYVKLHTTFLPAMWVSD